MINDKALKALLEYKDDNDLPDYWCDAQFILGYTYAAESNSTALAKGIDSYSSGWNCSVNSRLAVETPVKPEAMLELEEFKASGSHHHDKNWQDSMFIRGYNEAKSKNASEMINITESIFNSCYISGWNIYVCTVGIHAKKKPTKVAAYGADIFYHGSLRLKVSRVDPIEESSTVVDLFNSKKELLKDLYEKEVDITLVRADINVIFSFFNVLDSEITV